MDYSWKLKIFNELSYKAFWLNHKLKSNVPNVTSKTWIGLKVFLRKFWQISKEINEHNIAEYYLLAAVSDLNDWALWIADRNLKLSDNELLLKKKNQGKKLDTKKLSRARPDQEKNKQPKFALMLFRGTKTHNQAEHPPLNLQKGFKRGLFSWKRCG